MRHGHDQGAESDGEEKPQENRLLSDCAKKTEA